MELSANARVPGVDRDGAEISLTGLASIVAGYAITETRLRAEDTWLASVLDEHTPNCRGTLAPHLLGIVRWCVAVRARSGSLMCSALASTLDDVVRELDTDFPDVAYEIHAALWELENLSDRALGDDPSALEAGR